MLTNDRRFSPAARAAAMQAEAVRLSPVSLFEISLKTRLGKWPEMAEYIDELPELVRQQGIVVAAFTMEIASLAGSMGWGHRDPFDRMIAATAVITNSVLLSADETFATLADVRLQRIW